MKVDMTKVKDELIKKINLTISKESKRVINSNKQFIELLKITLDKLK